MTTTCTPQPPGILAGLGIYGYEGIEWPILAGLVTGDPILLVGNHGTAKTYLCRQLAGALELRFRAYDAAKNLFEDVLGFPDPAAMQDGRIGYIPTEISVWGTELLLVDEISRANPEMQSKWLEIIRNRTVMGKSIDGLQYILAAMNPPSYLGAYPLDAALAGRFPIIATTPDCAELPEAVRRQILGNWTTDDARLCQELSLTTPSSTLLSDLLSSARSILATLDIGLRDRLTDYAMNVAGYTQTIKRPLDGRRLGMLWRNCLAAVALFQAHTGQAIDDAHLDGLLYQMLCNSLPFAVIDGEPVNPLVYRTAHDYGMRHLGKSALQLSDDPLRAVLHYRASIAELTPQQHEMVVTYLAECWSATDREMRLRTAVAVLGLRDIATDPAIACPVDTRLRLLELLQSVTMPRHEILDDNDLPTALSLLINEEGGRVTTEAVATGMRLTVTAHTTLPNPDGRGVEFQDAGIKQTYHGITSLLTAEKIEVAA